MLAKGQFVLNKKRIIVRLDITQHGMRGIRDLDDALSLPHPSFAGAAAHLLHQLKGPFGGPEIGKMDDAVGIQDADEVHMLEVQSFDDHLRADEDIDPLLFELLDQRVMGRFAADAVDIHPCDAGFGKDRSEMFFDPLRPEIALDEAMVAAGGADVDRRVYGTAIMTMQFVGQLMKIERYVAVAALRDPAADLADLVGRIAAAILEKDDLAAGCQRSSRFRRARPGLRMGLP